MKTNYVVVSPVRDEEDTVEETIKSMVAQTIKPAKWVIVNDGSTDRTPEILARYAAKHDFIEVVTRENRGYRELGPGVVIAFNLGLRRAMNIDWDFVVKLDGDLAFGRDYFKTLLERFDANPRLGMASGKTFLIKEGKKELEWCHDEHVRGPAKMYSRKCFDDIGGIQAIRCWDHIDEVTAQMLGYETRSYLDLELIHFRPVDGRQGKKIFKSRYEMGQYYYYLGYHPLYLLMRSARSTITDYPLGVGGPLLMAGYASQALAGAERYKDDFVEFVQKKQMDRFKLGYLMNYVKSVAGKKDA